MGVTQAVIEDKLSEIENGIVTRIMAKNLGLITSRVQAKGEGPVNRYPSLFVATGSLEFERLGNKLKVKPKIYLIVTFKSLGKEEDRRKGINPIMLGIIQALFNQQLGLKIDAITPTSCRDITTEEDRQEGLVIFGLEVKTRFVVNTVDDSDLAAVDLISMGLHYFFQPDVTGDGQQDAEDDLLLGEEPVPGSPIEGDNIEGNV